MKEQEQRILTIQILSYTYDLLLKELREGQNLATANKRNTDFDLTNLDKPTLMALQIIPALFILGLKTEIAIKALILKTKSKDVTTRHDLDWLLKQLNGTLQNRIKYKVKQSMNLNSNVDYEVFLNTYKNTFIDWRYLYEIVDEKRFSTTFLEQLFNAVVAEL